MPATKTAPVSAKEFVSIKDAAERYQKAQITVRRFVKSIIDREKAADRLLIHPLPKEASELKKQHRPFSYTIAVDLLEKHFGNQPIAASPEGSQEKDSYRDLLEKTNAAFQEQLKVKDEQIRTLAQAIDDLSERQRETNVLMKGLQERLLLSAPKPDVVDAKASEPVASAEQDSKKKRWWSMWK